MTQQTLIVIALIVAVAVVVLLSQKSKGGDIVIPPAPARPGLFFGFYGRWGNQIAETAGWVNLHWELFRQGTDGAVHAIRAMGCSAVLDLDSFLYAGPPNDRKPADDGEAKLRAMFAELRDAGVLSRVKVLIPKDEPNLYGPIPMDTLPDVVAMVRRVAGEFEELAGVLLGCIFTTIRPWAHLDLFDVVGCDDYSAKSSILGPGGAITRMRAELRPDQRIWILPGASYGQDPTPFVNYANADAAVFAVIPFLHTAPKEEGFTDPGLRDQSLLLAQYEAAGKAIVGAKA